MKSTHHDVGCGLSAAVLDLHVSVVDNADDRLLVAGTAVTVMPIPDRLAAPVVGLERVFAAPAVFDVDVDRRRHALIIVREYSARRLVHALLLECPTDHLIIGAAGQAFRGPARSTVLSAQAKSAA